MVEWASQGLVPAGVDVYGVATGTASNRDNYPPSAWLEREGWPFPTLADSDTYQAAEAWGLHGLPLLRGARRRREGRGRAPAAS